MKGTCSVCGQFAGGHFAGCPEDTGMSDEERDEPAVDNDDINAEDEE